MTETCQLNLNGLLQQKHPQASEADLKILSAPPILCKTKLMLEKSDVDLFKATEKFYKLKKPYRQGKKTIRPEPTDFSDCLDLSDPVKLQQYLQENRVEKINDHCYRLVEEGLRGFYILPGVISIADQKELIQKSIHEWCLPPIATNVRRLIELGHNDYVNVPDSKTVLDTNGDRVRWANLGYKYDWTHREYFKVDTPPFELPEKIKTLCQNILTQANLSEKYTKYNPDSCLVNYYTEDTQFCGHIDDAELNAREFPIVSLSVGLSAVFLHAKGKNCQDRKIKPEAIRINSGDAIIMEDTSRLCLHGVPRVMENTFDASKFELDENFTEVELNYIQKHRLNINTRMYKGNVYAQSNEGQKISESL